MVEYIERGALWTDIMMLPHNGDIISSEDVEQAIKDVPAADVVEVRHGQWLHVHVAVVDTTGDCSVCNTEAVWRTRKKPYSICPNCGTRMDGDVNA